MRMAASDLPAQAWTAIVLAGRRPGGDAFAESFGEAYKGRIPIAGEPMLARVVRTLLAVPRVARILVVAQEPDRVLAGELGWIAAQPHVHAVISSDGIAASVARIAGGDDAPWPVLVTTADHPLLQPIAVESFLDGAADGDLAFAMVTRETLHRLHPGNKRTWLHFRGGAYTGANLFALRTPRVGAALDLWSRAEKDRKVVRRLVRHFGPWLALRALTRTISLDGAVAVASRRLGLAARAVLLDFPDAGIDVDKASDHALAERILLARGDGA